MLEGTSQGERQLHDELRGLKDLLNIAQIVVSSLDLDEVLQNILHSAMAIIDMPAGTIALYDETTSRLKLHAHAGLSERFVAKDQWTVKKGGLTHEILDRGELFVVEDTRQAEFFNNPLAVEEGICSLIAVPLKMQKTIIGVLYLDDFKPLSVPPARLEQLKILASFATMSIDNARLHAKTAHMACTDGLTGLYNHRQFKRVFPEEVARAIRYDKPLSIIMFDVDNFKAFNDKYGHPNGDIVLREIAGLLEELLRECDMVYRYGGEEFIALLPETGRQDALRVAERIRIFIETESRRFLTRITRTQGVTVSVGVASLPEDGQEPSGLLKTVDDLMYCAKRDGKNRVYYSQGVL
ncbi:MAG: sensor domain-containing diguanylate cyclase [Desulfuromonadales bacterium]|nr:sensor domain-containing diguanylate cyclase [Desulfuromonadales bacterium]